MLNFICIMLKMCKVMDITPAPPPSLLRKSTPDTRLLFETQHLTGAFFTDDTLFCRTPAKVFYCIVSSSYWMHLFNLCSKLYAYAVACTHTDYIKFCTVVSFLSEVALW